MKRTATIGAAALLLFVGISIITSSIPAMSSTKLVISPLLDLRDAYLNARSIHFKANFQISLYGGSAGGLIAGTGSYEYWSRGEKYRIHSSSERKLGLVNDFELLFDGDSFYFLDRNLALLSYQTGDGASHPTSLPNPLLLPFDFLDIASPVCADCRLRLRDIGNEDHWEKRTRGAQLEAHTSSSAMIRIPRSNTSPPSGHGFVIHLSDWEGQRLPGKIDRIDRDGRAIYSIGFHSYASGNSISSPRVMVPEVVVLTVYDTTDQEREKSDEIAAQTTIMVKAIQVNQPIEDSVFEMDLSRAERIWDGDTETFVRLP
ncbi:MAG: hypothetical protein GY856_02535 [bacterium]|nr:hypothetical protein [bacterium]